MARQRTYPTDQRDHLYSRGTGSCMAPGTQKKNDLLTEETRKVIMTKSATSETKSVVLRAEELSIGYKSGKQVSEIARNISFNLNRGELTGIIGANGIGKSTLLRTLSGIQPVLSGTVILEQKSLNKYTHTELAREISLVLTEQPPSKNLTVAETIALGRQPYTNWIGNLTENDMLKIQ